MLYARMAPEDVERLVALAAQEQRHPSDQAGVLLREALAARDTRVGVETRDHPALQVAT